MSRTSDPSTEIGPVIDSSACSTCGSIANTPSTGAMPLCGRSSWTTSAVDGKTGEIVTFDHGVGLVLPSGPFVKPYRPHSASQSAGAVT